PAPAPQAQAPSSGPSGSDAWSHLISQSSVSEPAPVQRDEPRTGSYGQLSDPVSEPVGSTFAAAPVENNQDPMADASASTFGTLWSQPTETDQVAQADAPDALARALSDFQQLDHATSQNPVSGSDHTERFYESSERSAFHGLETATPQAPVAPAPAVSLQSEPQVSSHSALSSLSEPVPASPAPAPSVDSYIPASSAQDGQNVDDPYAAFNQVTTGSSPAAPVVDPMAGYHPAASQPNIGGPSASAPVGHAPSVTVSGQSDAPAYDSPSSYQDGGYQGHEVQSGYGQDGLYSGAPGVPLSNGPHMSSGPHGTYSDPAVSQAAAESMPYLAEEGAVPYQQAQAMHEDNLLSEPAAGKSRKGLLAAGVVLGLAVLGGVAVWGLAGSGSENGESPVLVANTDPVKEAPDDPGGKVIPHQNKEVYDRIDGTSSDEGPNNLMPATEKPLALGEDGKSPRVISLSGGETSVPQQSADGGASSDRSIVAPKKVRTVIVRPDGTIVKSSEGSANAANGIGSVDQQMMAATPSEQAMGQSLDTVPGGGSDQTAVLGGNAAQTVGDGVTTSILPKRKPGGLINQQTSVASVQQPAVNSVAAAPATPVVTQTPTSRPAGNQPLSLLPPSNEQTNRTVQAPVVNRSGGSGGFTVQVSSQRTPEQARSSYSSIQSRVASVLGGYQPDIKRADLGSKGVFYRVRVGSFADRSGAIALCESIKAAGADCLVARQ
ncbi:MAG: SPOR domain-containing protein, partial [Cohaesibacter sp.]|nr:SPOR domain-containing protein [Cohaesibacter sp.]